MTSDATATIHRQAVAVAARVRLPVRSRVWKGRSGDLRGAGSGASLDFQDHRAYQSGDDPRHINWQAYARTGQHTMKLFREEVRPLVELVVDGSASMFYDPSKARLTAGLAFLVIHAAAASGAGIRVHTLCGRNTRTIDHDEARGHEWLAAASESPSAEAPDPGRIELRPHTVRVFLSDLLYPCEPREVLTPLAGRGSMLVLLCPYLTSEAEPTWEGNCEFVDVELGSRHPATLHASHVSNYRNAYSRHFDLWGEAAARRQVPLARIPADIALPEAVFRHAAPAGAFDLV